MEEFNKIWTEKYRPKTLKDMIISEETRELLESYKDGIPHLLFAGRPGTGKTSLAQVLVNSMLECNFLYINASDESGIDTIRVKVSGFSRTKSFDGKIKTVILDEADGLKPDGQKALRNLMESNAANTRFILTANYKHKIIPALQSRCTDVDVKPELKEAVRRCAEILEAEGIKIPEDQKVNFVELIKHEFPDMRKCINQIQKYSVSGVLKITRIGSDKELLNKISSSLNDGAVIKLRAYLIANEDRFSGDYDTLLADYLEHLYDAQIEDITKKQCIATIAEHLYQSVFIVDKEINCFACLIALEGILS